MSELIANCPRCAAKSITFDVLGKLHITTRFDWQNEYEIFAACRACSRSTTYIIVLKENYGNKDTIYKGNNIVNLNICLNECFEVRGFINLKNNATQKPPEYLPAEIENAFKEGSSCFAIGCYNASATMFRLSLDFATRPLLPNPDEQGVSQPNSRQRRDLGLRLSWLFEHNLLPSNLRRLAQCVREDGNDGAHAGNLTQADAEDLLDFTKMLLERLYTERKKLELAEERRDARRSS